MRTGALEFTGKNGPSCLPALESFWVVFQNVVVMNMSDKAGLKDGGIRQEAGSQLQTS